SKRAGDARKRQALSLTNGTESFARKTFDSRVRGLAIDPLTILSKTRTDGSQKLPTI
ncbi:hypothetical protein MKW92_041117, partial [Papaver armeniacum]